MKTKIWLLLLLLALFAGGCAQELAPEPASAIDTLAWADSLRTATLAVKAELIDNYAAYFTPEEYQMMLDDYNGLFAGVGIYMDQDEQGRVRVASVMPDRPAQAAGLEAGDIILAVDGEESTGVALETVMMRLRGEEGTEVTVDLLRERESGDLEYTVTIRRAIIERSSLDGEFLADQPGIAYITIYEFTERTPREFYDILIKLDEEHEILGMILDLRNNGGGSFGAAITLAGFFVPAGEPIVWEKTYGGETCHRSVDGALQDLPVVCLQNIYTASAAETLIGALKDYGVASVVGTVSFGKGITQALEPFPDGSGLKYTQSRYYTPLKYDLHGKGIEPDVLVEVPDDITAAEYFDPENENNQHMIEALKILNERIYVSMF